MKYECEYALEHLHCFFGWHIRGFVDKKYVFDFSPVKLSFDPCEHMLEEFLSFDNECMICRKLDTSVYVVIKCHTDNLTIVIGPVCDMPLSKNEAFHDLVQSGFSPQFAKDNYELYYEYRYSATSCQQIKIYNIIAIINKMINNSEFDGANSIDEAGLTDMIESNVRKDREVNEPSAPLYHNTYYFESEIFSFISSGNTNGLKRFLAEIKFSGNTGVLSADVLRNAKNLCIAAITLASRAAMSGGANIEQAYALSDRYINEIENQDKVMAVYYLQSLSMFEFTELVASEKRKGVTGRFAVDVHGYILENIDQKLTTEGIAESFGMNRTSLCKKFKAETGKSLATFITEVKMDEAKRLLSSSNDTLASIADSLSFSSQSHFQNCFKKNTGMTPGEYRRRYSGVLIHKDMEDKTDV